MPIIKSVRGFHPEFGEACWIAENATIVGDVKMGSHCSIWYNAVLRGDVNSIHMGNYVNVQDGAVIHATYEKSKSLIGNYVSIGHNAIVHGAIIGNNVLVGMGAIIMDNTVVNENVLIAAGAVVLGDKELESGFIYAGTPAKKIKPLDAENAKFYIERTALNYVKYASWFKEEEEM